MEFHYEVSAKVETLHLDGTTRYVLQGRISFHVPGEESAGEPLNLALVFPEKAWNDIRVGTILRFRGDNFYQSSSNQEWRYYDPTSNASEPAS